MKIIKLIIKTKDQKYPIFIGNNILKNFQNLLKKNSINFNQCLVIIDKNIPKKLINKFLYSLKLKKISIHYFKANEKNKNQKTTNSILKIKKVLKIF